MDDYYDSTSVYTTPAVPLSSDYFLYDKHIPPKGTPNDNPYYTCFISCPDKGILIKANMPQEYSLDFGTSYESSFSQSISENMSGDARKVGDALGLQFVTKALTAKVWQGSNDVTFSIPMILQLETDYYKDILEPLSNLYRLVLPTQSKAFGLLESPGPSLDLKRLKELAVDLAVDAYGALTSEGGRGKLVDDVSKALLDGGKSLADIELPTVPDPTAALLSCIKNNCFLVIGGYQYFDSVVITNVAQTTQVLPYYATGTMTRIEVVVTFSTFVVPTTQDLPSLLLGSDRSFGLDSAPGTVTSESPTLSGAESSADLLSSGFYGDTLSNDEYDEAYKDTVSNSGLF